MAITLIVNPGSSSKKYSLVADGQVVASMRFERSGSTFQLCTEQNGQQQKCEGVTSEMFTTALRQMLDTALRTKVISNLQDITAVGIRVVAPGTYFQSHHIVDGAYLHRLREREPAAPLHIPHTLAELELLQVELPHARIVGVSDSAFHATMPAVARDYSIEAHDTTQFDIHRFGYHGISVASVLPRVEAVLRKIPSRVVVCHVGSGVSMTALKDGVSIDTSMGFGPDSGLVMGTRAGDLDAGTLLELMRVKNMRSFDTLSYIQTRGGLKGLSDEADFRFILERVARDDAAARAALDHCVYRFQKQLGAYAVALGGLDAIILTATAVERSTLLRQLLLAHLEWLGITIDPARNEIIVGADGIISTEGSPVKVIVARTQELTEMLRITTAVIATNPAD